jgi:hypothetical protein
MGFGVVVQGLASHENYQARPLPALSAIGWVARLATTLPSFTSTSSSEPNCCTGPAICLRRPRVILCHSATPL